jgi:hypothetical protein
VVVIQRLITQGKDFYKPGKKGSFLHKLNASCVGVNIWKCCGTAVLLNVNYFKQILK